MLNQHLKCHSSIRFDLTILRKTIWAEFYSFSPVGKLSKRQNGCHILHRILLIFPKPDVDGSPRDVQIHVDRWSLDSYGLENIKTVQIRKFEFDFGLVSVGTILMM